MKIKDTVERWAAWDAFHDAMLAGALQGVFDLRADEKALQAHTTGNVAVVKKLTKERLAKLKGKPKFKKVPAKSLGLKAVKVKGSRAEAGLIYGKRYFAAHKREKVKVGKGK